MQSLRPEDALLSLPSIRGDDEFLRERYFQSSRPEIIFSAFPSELRGSEVPNGWKNSNTRPLGR